MYITVNQLANKINNLERFTLSELLPDRKPAFTDQEIEQAKQWIANVYHNCDSWGEKVSPEDMKINLIEWNREITDDYCPPVDLYQVLSDEWNILCNLHPN